MKGCEEIIALVIIALFLFFRSCLTAITSNI